MTVQELLARRQGLVVLPPADGPAAPHLAYALEVELARLGYALRGRLQRGLLALGPAALTALAGWLPGTLAASLGANQQHTPLFRKFPDGVPTDTRALWVQKVLAYYFQGQDMPCLSCGQVGTTHVLRPCQDVVCDHCFDGSNYSRCPVCERAADTSSPFFRPDEVDRNLSATETVTFKLLDLCEDPDAAAQKLYGSYCARAQAMSPDDVAALGVLVGAYGLAVLPWTPATIPVRENRAHIFGALLRALPADVVLAAARPHLGTGTDVLRLVAAYSGAEPGLQASARGAVVKPEQRARWSDKSWKTAEAIREQWAKYKYFGAPSIVIQSARFKVAKMGRPLRRGLLAILDSFPSDALVEDVLRRPALWVRLGEALHPFEYAARYPHAARAFAVARGARGALVDRLAQGVADDARYRRDAHGRLRFATFASQTEVLIQARDGAALGAHLEARPGELARRLDLALRLEVKQNQTGTAARFLRHLPKMSFPTLLGLATGLPRRDQKWPVRVYFPKGAEFKAPSAWDRRTPLPHALTGPLVAAIERELLRRLAEKPRVDAVVLDAALGSVVVPFNERTASPAAVSIARGSTVDVPKGKEVRLFLHWCQPEKGYPTDIDLSVGLYNSKWEHVDTCSYYNLQTVRDGQVIARSSGDMQDAPHPDGASEFIDLLRGPALACGVRYAVMVVNAYAGLSFSQLERGFAGLMVREDLRGAVFDPRTVQLRFNLQGDNGVFMPLVFDLQDSRMFWLDAYSTGQFAFNNVETSNAAIQRICPETMAYFGHGVRPSMFQLGALHAAARTDRVYVRDGGGAFVYERRPREGDHTFYQRLRTGDADVLVETLPAFAQPILAVLLRGDLSLPEGSRAYALYREQLTGTLAASDLLS